MRGGCYIYLYLEFDLRKENERIGAQHAGKWQRWQSVPSRAGSGPTWQGQTKKCVLVVVHVYKIEHDGIMFIIDI